MRPPQSEPAVLCCVNEVLVRAQQAQLMPDAQLRDESVHRPYLDAVFPATVSKVGRIDVVVAVGLNQRERCKAFEDLGLGLRCDEALQQLLEHKPGRDDDLRSGKSVLQRGDFWLDGWRIPSQSQGPDAGVNEQRHLRDRSVL